MNEDVAKLIEGGDTQKFYQSSEWRSTRKKVLERDNKECQMCKEEGRVGVGELAVHHVKHLKDRIDLALDTSNLITLCGYHHNVVHPEKLNNKRMDRFVNEEQW